MEGLAPTTFRSVGIGGPSITVQKWLPAGPIFQECHLASVAGYGLGSSAGSSRSAYRTSETMIRPACWEAVGGLIVVDRQLAVDRLLRYVCR